MFTKGDERYKPEGTESLCRILVAHVRLPLAFLPSHRRLDENVLLRGGAIRTCLTSMHLIFTKATHLRRLAHISKILLRTAAWCVRRVAEFMYLLLHCSINGHFAGGSR